MAKRAQPSRARLLKEAIQSLEAEYGAGVVRAANQAVSIRDDCETTGSLSLDCAVGIGGYPSGLIVEIFGEEASGKSSLGYKALASHQRAGKLAALVNAEHVFDRAYAASLGVNVEELLFVPTDDKSGEKALDVVATLTDNPDVGIVVVDTVAALVPEEEMRGRIGETSKDALAQVMSEALRKLSMRAARSRVTLLFLNQLRSRFHGAEESPAGRALKFHAAVRILLQVKDYIQDSEGEPLGVISEATVMKNKVGRPFRSTELHFVQGVGLDPLQDAAGASILLGWGKEEDRAAMVGKFEVDGAKEFKALVRRIKAEVKKG